MASLSERLDPYFELRDIAPQRFGLTGRKYEGDLNGRSIEVVASKRTRSRYTGEIRTHQYVGHRLIMKLDTKLRARPVPFPLSSFQTSLMVATAEQKDLKPGC